MLLDRNSDFFLKKNVFLLTALDFISASIMLSSRCENLFSCEHNFTVIWKFVHLCMLLYSVLQTDHKTKPLC